MCSWPWSKSSPGSDTTTGSELVALESFFIGTVNMHTQTDFDVEDKITQTAGVQTYGDTQANLGCRSYPLQVFGQLSDV